MEMTKNIDTNHVGLMNLQRGLKLESPIRLLGAEGSRGLARLYGVRLLVPLFILLG